MKLSIYYILFLLCAVNTLSADPVPGVPINGPIVPVDSNDTYATYEPWWGKGGVRNATNYAGLGSITTLRREAGMIVYLSETGEYWRLNNDLTTWSYWSTGGNIYTTDGFINATRTVNANGFGFYLTNWPYLSFLSYGVGDARIHSKNTEIIATGTLDLNGLTMTKIRTHNYGISNVWSGMPLVLQDDGGVEYEPIFYTGPVVYQTNLYRVQTPRPNYFGTNDYNNLTIVRFTIPTTNTGPAYIALADGPPRPVLTADKATLPANAMVALSTAEALYNKNLLSWILMNPALISSGGPSLTNSISDVVFLKDYGAVGDGFTDDTVAFLTAIAAAANRTLDIGKGLYVISPVTITNNVSIVGHHVWGNVIAPPNSTEYSGFLKKGSTTGHLFTISGSARVDMHYVYIDGNKANNTDATSYCLYYPAATLTGQTFLNHVVIVNSKGGGILNERANVAMNYLYNAQHELHGIRQNATGLKMDNVVIEKLWGDGILIDNAQSMHVENVRIGEVRGHGLNVSGNCSDSSLHDLTIEEPMKCGIYVTAAFQNNILDALRIWGANCQQNITGVTNGAYPQGTWSSILYDTGSYGVNNTRYVNSRIGGFHASLSGSYGTRKVKYNVEWAHSTLPKGSMLSFNNCYFLHTASTVSGNWQAGFTDTSTVINYADDVWTDSKGYYFNGYANLQPTNGLAITTIQNAVSGNEYPLVIDTSTGVVKRYPTNYSLAFTGGIGWVKPNPRRVINYVFEDFAAAGSSAIGSYSWSGTLSSGGSVGGIAGILDHPGVMTLHTSTATNGGFSISSRGDAYSFSSAETWSFSIQFKVNGVSTNTADYQLGIGFGDVVNTPADVDFVGLVYNSVDNAAHWRLLCREASTSTYSDTAAVGLTAGTWHTFSMTFTTTSCTGDVDGVSLGTITSNIPDGANKVGLMIKIFNTGIAPSPGIDHIMDIDWFQFLAQRASDR